MLNVFPVMHIVGWNPPTTDQCVVVPVDHIDEICICKELKDTGIVYIANLYSINLRMKEHATGSSVYTCINNCLYQRDRESED